jgi:hypothetical protein
VSNILNYLISTETLVQFTWSRGPAQFKNFHNIRNVIVRTVKSMTDDKFKNIAISTLKNAKSKLSHRRQKYPLLPELLPEN